MVVGEDGVFVAVDDKGRNVDLVQTVVPGVGLGHGWSVVDGAGVVEGAVKVAGDELGYRRVLGIAGAFDRGEGPDLHLDDGVAVGPGDLVSVGDELEHSGMRWRELGDFFASEGVRDDAGLRGGHDWGEREGSVGVVESDELGDHAAHGDADNVRLVDLVGVEH